IMVRASNAEEVIINGSVAFNGAGGTFIHSGLSLSIGLNKLEIVARNAGKSYAVTREVIYFSSNAPTPHNIIASETGSSAIQLDTAQVVQPFTNRTIEGKLIVRLPNVNDVDAPPTVTLSVYKDGNPNPINVI